MFEQYLLMIGKYILMENCAHIPKYTVDLEKKAFSLFNFNKKLQQKQDMNTLVINTEGSQKNPEVQLSECIFKMRLHEGKKNYKM